MPTTPQQIEAMRGLCSQLEASPLVNQAHLDDWGRHGNFIVMIWPVKHARTTTNQLKAAVRRCLKDTKAEMRQCFSPERRSWGYHVDYWKFDVDFEEYDPATNLFASQDEPD